MKNVCVGHKNVSRRDLGVCACFVFLGIHRTKRCYKVRHCNDNAIDVILLLLCSKERCNSSCVSMCIQYVCVIKQICIGFVINRAYLRNS